MRSRMKVSEALIIVTGRSVGSTYIPCPCLKQTQNGNRIDRWPLHVDKKMNTTVEGWKHGYQFLEKQNDWNYFLKYSLPPILSSAIYNSIVHCLNQTKSSDKVSQMIFWTLVFRVFLEHLLWMSVQIPMIIMTIMRECQSDRQLVTSGKCWICPIKWLITQCCN